MNGEDITGIRGLHVRPIEINDSNKYNNYIESVYNLSITLYEYLTKQFEKQIGETLEDFWWLRTAATRPAFHHLCFNYKGYVYSCLIGFLENNEIKVLGQDWNNFMRETENNALHACIIPIEFKNDESIRVHTILDAKNLKPTQFNMTNTHNPISDWEIYCMGVNEVVSYLMNNEIKDIQYCDIPSINPSIWFVDENGQKSYVVVRSVPMGVDEEPYTINKSYIDEYSEQGIKGYFVNVLWGNAFGGSGMFIEKELTHQYLLRPQITLEPIEEVEKNHKNIKITSHDL